MAWDLFLFLVCCCCSEKNTWSKMSKADGAKIIDFHGIESWIWTSTGFALFSFHIRIYRTLSSHNMNKAKKKYIKLIEAKTNTRMHWDVCVCVACANCHVASDLFYFYLLFHLQYGTTAVVAGWFEHTGKQINTQFTYLMRAYG